MWKMRAGRAKWQEGLILLDNLESRLVNDGVRNWDTLMKRKGQ